MIKEYVGLASETPYIQDLGIKYRSVVSFILLTTLSLREGAPATH
jgi:hypothetical protein